MLGRGRVRPSRSMNALSSGWVRLEPVSCRVCGSKSGDATGLVVLVPALQGAQAEAGVLGQSCQSDVVFDVEPKDSPLLWPVHFTPA